MRGADECAIGDEPARAGTAKAMAACGMIHAILAGEPLRPQTAYTAMKCSDVCARGPEEADDALFLIHAPEAMPHVAVQDFTALCARRSPAAGAQLWPVSGGGR